MKARLFSILLVACAAPALADDAALRAEIAAKLQGVEADDLRESPVPGLYEVTVGASVLYVSSDGRYLLRGELVDLATRTNLTEQRIATARADWVRGLDERQMIVFEPEGRTRHTLTVFTDVDCSYCRALHADIDELLERGVRVRYLLYPRNGPDTPSAAKAAHVWCSPDRQTALTRAKAGRTVTAPACETPILATLQLGREIPVTGTPTMVTDGGDVIPGFLPAGQLVDELDRLSALHD